MNLASRSNLRIKAAFAFALFALLAVGGIAYRDRQTSVESSLWVDHTYKILESLQDLQATMDRVESSYAGFAWTGQDSYLDAYHASVAHFGESLATVRALTADNPNQQRLIPQVAALSVLKIQRGEELIGIRQSGGLSAVAGVGRSPTRPASHAALSRDPGRHARQRIAVAGVAHGGGGSPPRPDQCHPHSGNHAQPGRRRLRQLERAARQHRARPGSNRRCGESEERYLMLLDGLQDYAIFVLDPRGRVSGWNAGASRITGYTAEQIMGRDFSCFFPSDQVEQGRPAKVLKIATEKGAV